MEEFKGELSNLILRYTINPPKSHEDHQVPVRLTNQQILDSVRDTLCATLKMNMQNSENKSSGLTTPVNEIVVSTPHAPDIVRVDYPRDKLLENNLSQERNELLNVNSEVYPKSPYPSPVSTDDEMRISDNESSMDKADGELMEKDDGFVSADLVFQDRKDSLTEIQKKLDRIQEDLTPKNESKKNVNLYDLVEEAHKGATKAMENLENLRQLLMPEPRPIRRLSAMMCLPHNPKLPQLNHQQRRLSLGNNSNSLRTIQLSKALRRSVNNHQDGDYHTSTPTTSRPSINVHQASTSTSAHNPPPAKKPANLPKTPGVSKLGKSASSVSGVAGSSRPGGGGVGAVRVNPRYAHVQSTIPKPASANKRKAQ
ncbi:hypothetical protein QAD02_011947 [Eretmocerus hayati]|uniref:Uncharacterized protein n=1 Tax=Eretmocerus hayati TaxID=131215 RepID=A0ACC2NYC2_9HYME|nr:hypothetical protein QAD02_011947 [Eretmocerus hayati]